MSTETWMILIMVIGSLIIVGIEAWDFLVPHIKRYRTFKECAELQEKKHSWRWPTE